MNVPLDHWNGSKNVAEALDRIQKANAWPQRVMLILTAVAAIAAIIAAVPVVKGWFS